MGRHSAPDDDVIDVEVVDATPTDQLDDEPTGRHARIAAEAAAAEARAAEDAAVAARARGTGRPAAAGRARPAPERSVEQTGVIPQSEVEDAARDDAVERTLRGPRPAELLPVLPGEAIVPPTDAEPLGPAVAESVPAAAELDDVAVLDAVLDDGEADDADVDDVPGVDGAGIDAAVDAAVSVDDRPSRPLPRARVEADDAPADGPAAPEPADTPTTLDEHAAPDADSAAPDVATSEQPAVAAKRRPLHHGAAATAADLALLRGDRALLARTLTAFLTPFVLYAIALVVAGAGSRTYLVWIWIPAIVACVGAGSLLDVAHKRVTVPPDVPIAAATELTGPIDVVPSAAADAPTEDDAEARETDPVSGS